MTDDLLTTLDKLRPDTEADELWTHQLRAIAHDRIVATPTDSLVSDTHRRKIGTIVLVAAIATTGGIGVAAAAGLMPKSFTDAYAHWQNYPASNGIDPDTAERIASLPGPDGTVFSIFAAQNADGWRCVAPVFESVADSEHPGPADFTKLGDSCRQADPPAGVPDPNAFGNGAGIMVEGANFVYDAGAGEAVRAELHTVSGQNLPAMLAEDRFYAWGPISLAYPEPVLVGYYADGTMTTAHTRPGG